MSETSRDPDARTMADSPFTVSALRTLLENQVMRTNGPKASLHLPSREALSKLASRLNTCHRLFHLATGPWKQSDALTKRATQAVNELGVVLPQMRAELDTCLRDLDGDDDPFAQIIRGDIEYVAALNQAVVTAQQRFSLWIGMANLLTTIKKSKDLAPSIADAFRKAMSSTNPDAPFGRSNDGPVARFVAAVLPQITGDTPTAGAVGKMLNRTMRDNDKY